MSRDFSFYQQAVPRGVNRKKAGGARGGRARLESNQMPAKACGARLGHGITARTSRDFCLLICGRRSRRHPGFRRRSRRRESRRSRLQSCLRLRRSRGCRLCFRRRSCRPGCRRSRRQRSLRRQSCPGSRRKTVCGRWWAASGRRRAGDDRRRWADEVRWGAVWVVWEGGVVWDHGAAPRTPDSTAGWARPYRGPGSAAGTGDNASGPPGPRGSAK